MDSGWSAGGLGAAVGVIIYAGAEIARRVIGAAPKDDPVVRQLHEDLAEVIKRLDAALTQLDNLRKDHDAVHLRVDKIERNGRKK